MHAVLIGVAMGTLGFAVDWAVVTLNTIKYGATRAAIRGPGGLVLPYLTYVSISVGCETQRERMRESSVTHTLPQQWLM